MEENKFTDNNEYTITLGQQSKILLPLQMNFKPKEDITSYELALCLKHLFVETYPYNINEQDSYLRHFEIINQNK